MRKISFLLSTPLLILPLSTNAAILAYYSFDSDFTDSSGNGNDLTGPVTTGGATVAITSTSGEHMFGGGAADFNSLISNSARLDLTTQLGFTSSDSWSVAFWARHRPGNDGRTGMILGDLNSTDFIWIPRDGAVDGLRFRNSSNVNADFTTPPGGVEAAGVYHHFAVIADGLGNVELFYDNASLGSQALDTSFDITSVGQAFTLTTQTMNGQIDELYIYDEAIDAATVNALFTNTAVPEPSSIALLGFGAVFLLGRKKRTH